MGWVPDERRSVARTFLGLSLVLAGVSAWAIVDEVWVRRPWKAYQSAYLELKPELGPARIHQIVVPELDLVDRCMTCHAGIADPDLVDIDPVLRTHPKSRKRQRFIEMSRAEIDALKKEAVDIVNKMRKYQKKESDK